VELSFVGLSVLIFINSDLKRLIDVARMINDTILINVIFTKSFKTVIGDITIIILMVIAEQFISAIDTAVTV
jgi:hypothetical protein